MVEKTDANFQGGLFFDKIADTNVVIGAYPLFEKDVIKLKEKGITAVLNLQTDQDMQERHINWKKIKDVYKKNKIRCYRFPINDFDEVNLSHLLFVGA